MSEAPKNKIKAAIFGGSGYGGSELLRILLFHPNVRIALVTANEHAGKAVSDVHKNLLGLTDLRFEKAPKPGELGKLGELDLAFFALPHGQALELIPQLGPAVRVIDLSGDFRLDDPKVFKQFYQLDHTAADLQKRFVYGLTETNREQIKSARYIANPGCFATATLLALAPLTGSGSLITGKVIVDAKTGSSGSGAKPAANTHHPQRMNSFYAYKPFTHQHVPEIEQHLSQTGAWENELIFMTHSLPVSRGIFASCYVELKDEMTGEELSEVYLRFYKPSQARANTATVKKGALNEQRARADAWATDTEIDSFFVRLVDGSPDINWVKNTNFCDIAVHVQGRQAVIFSALDNLVKGAAGQAVQNMNLMFGLDEKTGLIFTGSNP